MEDPQTDVFNNQKLVVLYTLLFSFLPEMRNVVKVYNNSMRFVGLQRKAVECKRKRELIEQIKNARKRSKCSNLE